MPKKKNTERVDSRVWSGFKEFGRGILKFFQLLFDFVVKLFKILPEFLKGLAWIILVTGGISVLVTLVAIYFLSVLGVKDSEQWQIYRETILGNVFEEVVEDAEVEAPLGE